MSFGFSVGDFISIGALLVTTVRKCRAASKEFQELSLILETTASCVQSAGSTLQPIFDQLPATHQNAVASALVGLRKLTIDLDSELERYVAIKPGKMQLVKLRFALLGDCRTAESKLTVYLSMLNTCMAMITCDSMTRPNLQPYNLANLASASTPQTTAPQTAPQTTPQTTPKTTPQTIHQTASQSTQPAPPQQPTRSIAEQWLASATSGSPTGQSPSKPFAARGVYTYNAGTAVEGGYPRTDRVDFELHVSNSLLHGTSRDSVGVAAFGGQIDYQRDTIRFTKQYGSPLERIRWEYDGIFTPCGIVGEWHAPGDPPSHRHIRGRFAIWLRSDEAAQGGDFENQLQLLENNGALLTTSLSFRNS